MTNNSISIISDNFPSPGRPVFIFVQQLVFALVDMGVAVTVVAPQSLTHALIRGTRLLPTASTHYSNKGHSFKVYRPYSLSFGNGHKCLYQMALKYNSRRINHVLSQINPDIIYGHFWHNANKVRDYAIRNNIPLFVACGEGDNSLEDFVRALSDEEKISLKKVVKGVISVSTENKRKSIAHGLIDENNVIVLPNCVDTNIIHPSSNRDFRSQLGVNDDDFLIVFVGGFINRKGAGRLSSAIDLLHDDHIKVAFIGKPISGDVCLPRCEGIVFQGPLEHDAVAPFLQVADLFVLPTLKEGCSNAIVEALASGLPVVSSNRPFNDDILNENNSIVVDPESIEAIADAILQMKNNKDLYAAKKEYTVRHSGDFSIDERARKIYEFILSHSVLSSH